MTSFKRPLTGLGAGVLLALSLTACGGYPSDASAKDFCGGVEDIITASGSVAGEEPTEKEWEKIQASYEDLGEIGTPDDISDDERTGFEVIVDTVTGLDYDEAKEEFGDKGGDDELPGVSKSDSKKVDTFFEYAEKACPDLLGG